MPSDSNLLWMVVQEAIGPAAGAFLGFALGVVLNDRESAKRRRWQVQETRTAQLHSLRYAHGAIWGCINDLLTQKQQLSLPLAEDVVEIKQAFEAWRNGGVITPLLALLQTKESFFRSFEEFPHDLSDIVERADFVTSKRIEVVHVMGDVVRTLTVLRSFVEQRNAMLGKYADATVNGPTPGHLNYFIPMLVSLSDGIYSKQNYALFFCRRLSSALEAYAADEFPNAKFNIVTFDRQGFQELMPAYSLINNYYRFEPKKQAELGEFIC